MRLSLYFCLVVLAGLALPRLAGAAWDPLGTPVCGTGPDGCDGGHLQAIPDGAGGMFLAWTDARDYVNTGDNVYAQRVTAEGEIAPGWPATGLPVSTATRTQAVPQIAPDGLGGILVAWQDLRNSDLGTSSDVYVQRVTGDGRIAPGWAENGVPATRALDYQGSFVRVCGDGAGGAFVAWDDYADLVYVTNTYAQHVDAHGQVAEGWPENGRPVCRFWSSPSATVPDGSGGVVVVWADGRRFPPHVDVMGLRLTAGGAIASGWAENGNVLVPERRVGTGTAVPDGTGDILIGCSQFDPYGFGSSLAFTAQRFRLDGSLAPGWPIEGVTVGVAPGDRYGPVVAGDGLGGLLLGWYDYRSPRGGSDVYASRVRGDATLPAGWPLDGLLLSDPGNGGEFVTSIAPDGQGGAYVVWESQTSFGTPCRLQHVTSDGTVAPGWPPFGFRVSETVRQNDTQLVPDGEGGVIAAWEHSGRMYAKRFDPDGPRPLSMGLEVAPRALTPSPTGRWLTATLTPRDPHTVAQLDLESLRLDGLPPDPDAPVTPAGGSLLVRFPRPSLGPAPSAVLTITGTIAGLAFRGRDTVEVVRGPAARAELADDLPPRFALHGASPNPARGVLHARFSLPDARPAVLELFDLHGRRLVRQDAGGLGPGQHRLALEARDMAPGVYLLRLTREGPSLTTRVAVVR